MQLRFILASILLLFSSFSPLAFSLTIIPDDVIEPKNDLVIINEAINQELSDKIVLKLHELQSVNKDKPIYLLLDSPGGEVIEGARIIDSMAASKRPVYTVAMGEAASMAAIIHSYGVKRYMLPNSILMYHFISGSYSGDVVHVTSRLHVAQMLNTRYIKHISEVSSVKEETLNQKLMVEWWVAADEAIEQKLIDDTIISTAFYIPKDDKKKEDKPPLPSWFPWPQK